MKRVVRVFFAVLMLCLSVFVLAGCGGDSGEESNSAAISSSNVLVGTWKGTGNETGYIMFSDDGTFKDGGNGVAEMAGDYVINEADHTVTCKESDYGLTFTYAYTISGSSLTLQVDGGLPRTFEK